MEWVYRDQIDLEEFPFLRERRRSEGMKGEGDIKDASRQASIFSRPSVERNNSVYFSRSSV